MSIGQVAGEVGMSTSAIRYYDGADLIGELPRHNGQRRFDDKAVTRLRFVKTAQALGFSLDEIRELLHPSEDYEWAQLVAAKRSDLEATQLKLQAMIDMLEESLGCGCEAFDKCPTFITATSGSTAPPFASD